MNLELTSPLLEKYQKYYENNSSSRIFAPLAESYRKLGLIEDAFFVLKKGIKKHPDYPMGFLVLATCYYDKEEYDLAYNTLKPLISTNRDNIRLQKIFAEVAIKQNKIEEALDTFKYLLFINPRDKDVANKVKDLEEKINPIIQKNEVSLKKNQLQVFDISNISSGPIGSEKSSAADNWVQIDLSDDKKIEESANEQIIIEDEEDSSSWQVSDIAKIWKKAIDNNDKRPIKIDIGGQENIEEPELDFPVITHTLVNLYCQQGYYSKAKEILEKLLLIDPNDNKTLEKIEEIQQIIKPTLPSEIKEISKPFAEIKIEKHHPIIKNEGRDKLMQCFEQKLNKNNDSKILTYEKRFNAFLSAIKNKAENYHSI